MAQSDSLPSTMECDLSESDMNEHQTISFKAFQDYLKFRLNCTWKRSRAKLRHSLRFFCEKDDWEDDGNDDIAAKFKSALARWKSFQFHPFVSHNQLNRRSQPNVALSLNIFLNFSDTTKTKEINYHFVSFLWNLNLFFFLRICCFSNRKISF